jgi:branched-chain amino acid transport system permease protein
VIGVAIERLVIRPVEGSSVLAVVVVFIGLLVICNSLAGWIFTYTIKPFPSPFPAEPLFGNHYLSSHGIGAIAITLVVLVLLFLFFRFTRSGLRCAPPRRTRCRRASAASASAGRRHWAGGLAAVIGAIAGMMVAPIVYLDPNMMSGILLYAFAAALLGGIDNPVGRGGRRFHRRRAREPGRRVPDRQRAEADGCAGDHRRGAGGASVGLFGAWW